MKFYYCINGPAQKHRDKSFTRSITAVTMENPREPGRACFLDLKIRMTYQNQSVEVIKAAIEEKVDQPIKLVGGTHFTLPKNP